MRQAFALALILADRWVNAYSHAFSPLVLNLCGSESGDGDPALLAKRIERLGTVAGKCVIANAYLTSQCTKRMSYPDADDEIDEPWAKGLYAMSSLLPDVLRERARWSCYSTTDESRHYASTGIFLNLLGSFRSTRSNLPIGHSFPLRYLSHFYGSGSVKM